MKLFPCETAREGISKRTALAYILIEGDLSACYRVTFSRRFEASLVAFTYQMQQAVNNKKTYGCSTPDMNVGSSSSTAIQAAKQQLRQKIRARLAAIPGHELEAQGVSAVHADCSCSCRRQY